MLKIKDDVDLKELEKFGFQKTDFKYFRSVPTFKNKYDFTGFEIYIKSGNFEGLDGYSLKREKGEIVIYGATSDHDEYFGIVHNQDLAILFDLIQANLVEKGE